MSYAISGFATEKYLLTNFLDFLQRMLTISETKQKIAELKKRKQKLEQLLSEAQVGREESVGKAGIANDHTTLVLI